MNKQEITNTFYTKNSPTTINEQEREKSIKLIRSLQQSMEDINDDCYDAPTVDMNEEDNGNNKVSNDGPSFEVFYNKNIDNKEPLSEVIGHQKQKEELISVIKWFKNSKELKKRGVSIPKGVVLYGKPGNGKSLMIKEMIKYLEAPVFVFKGDQNNVAKGVEEVFENARKEKHAVIVFDEIDLLINRENRVIRALQENLDGVESDDDILVLAATNSLDEIPDALLRNGRLEKIIFIPNPKGEEAVELMKKHFNEFNVTLPEDFDDKEIGLALNGICCAGVKAIVNDVVLRNGFDNITVEMIDDSISNVSKRVKRPAEKEHISVAIHEAGHAIVAKEFPVYFYVNKLNIAGASGEFMVKEVDEDYWTYKKSIANIMICLAGNIAQKVIFGEGALGCENDLEKARSWANGLYAKSGLSSASLTLPDFDECTRPESQYSKYKIEVKASRLLRKCERKVYRIIKKNKEKVKVLGNALFEKKHLKSKEILSLIG